MLRRFLYKDEDTVDDFLGQLELGVIETSTTTETKEREGNAKLGTSGVGFGGKRSAAMSSESNMRQNFASKFERLWRLLKSDDQAESELWELENIDSEVWNCLGRGSLISIEAHISVPAISRALGASSDVVSLMEIVKAFAPDRVTREDEAAVTGISRVASTAGEMVTVVASVEGDRTYSFICKLEKDGLLTEISKLEGEAIILAQIQDLIQVGETEDILDLPGASAMNRSERRAMAKKRTASKEPLETTVDGPGAILHPVAIYRG
jgi:hypothetical protein